MLQDRIAHRYALSLYQLAEETQKVDTILEDMRTVKQVYDSSEQFRVLLRSPIITAYKKLPILREIFKGKISDAVMLFLETLTLRSREALLPVIITEFLQCYYNANGMTKVRLTSAAPLDANHRNEIVNSIEKQLGTKVVVEETIDPSLIAGFEFQIGTQLFDASLANALRKVRKELQIEAL